MRFLPHSSLTPGNTRAFTLIEMLVVIAIVGILAALASVPISKALDASRTTTTISNLRQLQTANQAYANDNNGWYVMHSESFNHPWRADPEFLKYLGKRGNGWADPSKVVLSGFPENKSWIAYSIPKTQRPSGAPAHFWEAFKMRLRVLQIQYPSTLVAFIDANDWWVNPEAWNNWQSRAKNDIHGGGNAMVAYRNSGKAAAVTFGGNVVLLGRDDMNPETEQGARRWYFNGSKWD